MYFFFRRKNHCGQPTLRCAQLNPTTLFSVLIELFENIKPLEYVEIGTIIHKDLLDRATAFATAAAAATTTGHCERSTEFIFQVDELLIAH